MSAWTTTGARQVANLARLSSSKSVRPTPQAANFIYRRGLAGGGGDHHGPSKVNFWEAPLTPSKWKKGQLVIVSLTGGGLLCYGGYMYFTESKKEEEKKEERVGSASK